MIYLLCMNNELHNITKQQDSKQRAKTSSSIFSEVRPTATYLMGNLFDKGEPFIKHLNWKFSGKLFVPSLLFLLLVVAYNLFLCLFLALLYLVFSDI